jgi:hypothetical protein
MITLSLDETVSYQPVDVWFLEGKKKKLLHHHCSVEGEFVMAVPIANVFA